MFLSLAFADQAFEDINPRQLGYLKIDELTSHLPLKIKDSMLEVPNLFLQAAQEMGRLHKLRGMNFYKQSHALSCLPHSENQKIIDDPEYKRLEAIESEVLGEIAQDMANKECVGSVLQKRLAGAISKRKNYYRRAYERAYRKYRSDFFQEVGPREVQRQIQAMEGSDEETSISDSFSDLHHSGRVLPLDTSPQESILQRYSSALKLRARAFRIPESLKHSRLYLLPNHMFYIIRTRYPWTGSATSVVS
ncbi:hypothetical protein VE00_11189 [Pseudogymnoascus sp. WSF 3629]|nr:hypothetical protein VE00_11189 [Pseudogymnoascus sp. WSF 3629]